MYNILRVGILTFYLIVLSSYILRDKSMSPEKHLNPTHEISQIKFEYDNYYYK